MLKVRRELRRLDLQEVLRISDAIHQDAGRSGRIEALRRTPDIKNWTTQVSASEQFESSVWEDYFWRFERKCNHARFVLRTRRVLGICKGHATSRPQHGLAC